jgi:hypothetical protein
MPLPKNVSDAIAGASANPMGAGKYYTGDIRLILDEAMLAGETREIVQSIVKEAVEQIALDAIPLTKQSAKDVAKFLVDRMLTDMNAKARDVLSEVEGAEEGAAKGQPGWFDYNGTDWEIGGTLKQFSPTGFGQGKAVEALWQNVGEQGMLGPGAGKEKILMDTYDAIINPGTMGFDIKTKALDEKNDDRKKVGDVTLSTYFLAGVNEMVNAEPLRLENFYEIVVGFLKIVQKMVNLFLVRTEVQHHDKNWNLYKYVSAVIYGQLRVEYLLQKFKENAIKTGTGDKGGWWHIRYDADQLKEIASTSGDIHNFGNVKVVVFLNLAANVENLKANKEGGFDITEGAERQLYADKYELWGDSTRKAAELFAMMKKDEFDTKSVSLNHEIQEKRRAFRKALFGEE